jgi:hypothetical protein
LSTSYFPPVRWALRLNDLSGALAVAQLPLERVIFQLILNYAF